jgi:hypothetical protein
MLMATKFWQTKEFKKQQREWYEKAAEGGTYKDIEKVVGGQSTLIQRASNAYRQAPRVVRQNKLAYYQLLATRVNEEKFDDAVDELVMRMLADGAKIRSISDELKVRGHRHHRQTIRYIVRKYEVRWNIKRWKQSQMTSKR